MWQRSVSGWRQLVSSQRWWAGPTRSELVVPWARAGRRPIDSDRVGLRSQQAVTDTPGRRRRESVPDAGCGGARCARRDDTAARHGWPGRVAHAGGRAESHCVASLCAVSPRAAWSRAAMHARSAPRAVLHARSAHDVANGSRRHPIPASPLNSAESMIRYEYPCSARKRCRCEANSASTVSRETMA